MAFMAASVVALICSVSEKPNVPARVLICMYALQCLFHPVVVWMEYHRRSSIAVWRRGEGSHRGGKDSENGIETSADEDDDHGGEEVSLLSEDWRLSQLWYSPETATAVAQEVFHLSNDDRRSSVACIACPTLFAYVKHHLYMQLLMDCLVAWNESDDEDDAGLGVSTPSRNVLRYEMGKKRKLLLPEAVQDGELVELHESQIAALSGKRYPYISQ